jgi:hypothetical protein
MFAFTLLAAVIALLAPPWLAWREAQHQGVIKLAVLGALLYVLIKDAIPGLIGLSGAKPRRYPAVLLALAAGMLVKIVLALFVIGTLDLMFARWEYAKKMRMSKRDVKDEAKNRAERCSGAYRIGSMWCAVCTLAQRSFEAQALHQSMLQFDAVGKALGEADVW